MAINISKLIYGKATRLVHLPTKQNMQLRFSSKIKKCEQNGDKNRCGLRQSKRPSRVANKCEIFRDDSSNPCSGRQQPFKKNNLNYALKSQDNLNECCVMSHSDGPLRSNAPRVGFKLHVPKSPWQMLHWRPDCCAPCLPEPPRFDELHYKIRKMNEKEYFPTWAECPQPRFVPKLVCCYDNKQAETPRRIRSKPIKTACPLPEDVLNRKLLVCKVGGDPNCVKVFSPYCCSARNPPKCLRIRQPICLERIAVPSPSFSECCKPAANPKRTTQCRCLVEPVCGYYIPPPNPVC